MLPSPHKNMLRVPSYCAGKVKGRGGEGEGREVTSSNSLSSP